MIESLKAMTFFQKKAVNTTRDLIRSLFVVFIAFFVLVTPLAPVFAYAENMQGSPLKSTDFLSLKEGETATYRVTYKNNGKATWLKSRVFVETGDFLRSFSKIQSASWLRYYRPTGLPNDVKPGDAVTLSFSITAPAGVNGDIQQNFQLVDNGEQPIKGTTLRLFVTVGKPVVVTKAPVATTPVKTVVSSQTVSTYQPPKTTYSPVVVAQTTVTKVNPSSFSCSATGVLTTEQIASYANCNTAAKENDSTNGQSAINSGDRSEPMMRVGLFSTTQSQRVTHESVIDVYAEYEPLFSGIAIGEVVTLGYDFTTKKYSASVQGMTKYSAKQLRVVPRTKNTVASLLDYRNNPVGSGTTRDNRFRNTIEMQYSAKTGKLWLINELPLGYYLKGLGETSAASPVEFQKVMLSAARTYAMYHYNRGVDFKIKDGSTKHADEHFHLDSTYDQVYRGYSSELRIPTLVQAEDQTRGLVITYQDKVVVTPYYSRSDGRTRSWTEVWGGSGMPWLQSVAVPQDAGQTLWGHGVGMSARGALLMVVKEKKSWDTVIKYFYTGVQIKKIY